MKFQPEFPTGTFFEVRIPSSVKPNDIAPGLEKQGVEIRLYTFDDKRGYRYIHCLLRNQDEAATRAIVLPENAEYQVIKRSPSIYLVSSGILDCSM